MSPILEYFVLRGICRRRPSFWRARAGSGRPWNGWESSASPTCTAYFATLVTAKYLGFFAGIYHKISVLLEGAGSELPRPSVNPNNDNYPLHLKIKCGISLEAFTNLAIQEI